MRKEAALYEKLDGDRVRCGLCSHRCVIFDGKAGICGVRRNKEGRLYTDTYGDIAASHVDPIEKKPLYHFLPGSMSYSIAAAGCNFKCGFCQNWQISQAAASGVKGGYTGPRAIVDSAKKYKCASVSYTYTEPTVFFEYAYDVARLARDAGLYNIFVTNGYMTREAIEMIRPYLDACNVDIKGFSESFYSGFCKARLGPVLESVRLMKRLGIWVEITTLVVPDQNDSDEELKGIADFISSVGPETPWHVSRFHPDYEYLDSAPTPIETLRRAKEIGEKAGLRYVYLGNTIEGNNTYCHNCGNLLIERVIFDMMQNNVRDGRCPGCGAVMEGVF
ncbi:MAG: AmmeMemoRadiSam system radical SAM enzyme [Candidatus Omnitrophota bacterium]